MSQCQGITNAGTRCKLQTQEGLQSCHLHQGQQRQKQQVGQQGQKQQVGQNKEKIANGFPKLKNYQLKFIDEYLKFTDPDLYEITTKWNNLSNESKKEVFIFPGASFASHMYYKRGIYSIINESEIPTFMSDFLRNYSRDEGKNWDSLDDYEKGKVINSVCTFFEKMSEQY